MMIFCDSSKVCIKLESMWILILLSQVWVSVAQVTLSPPPEPAPLSGVSTCDRDMIRMNDRMFPRLQGVRDLCHQHPEILVASLKLNLTRYLCLYHSDLECLRKTQTFMASYNQGNRRASDYAADFERIVGSRYINTWINDDPNKTYNHPALRNVSQGLDSGMDGSLGAGAVSSVASLISKVVPYGNILDLAATGLGALTSMGRSETSPDPNNMCSTARDAYINATPEGRSCSPNFNFNSEPVARFLRQTPERQAQGLKCNDTCRYYAGLLTTLESTNAMIGHFSMPIFESRPQCLSGGRVSFSFGALNQSKMSSELMVPPRNLDALSWKGLVTTQTQTDRGSFLTRSYYRFQDQASSPGIFSRWQVTGDMTMRSHITATVDPEYSLGKSQVQLTIPQISQNSHRVSSTWTEVSPGTYRAPEHLGNRVPAGFATPRLQVGSVPGPSLDVIGLHELQDPAIQGMGLATAAVTGCCSVPNPNRDKCLDELLTIENFRPRDAANPSAPATVNQ